MTLKRTGFKPKPPAERKPAKPKLKTCAAKGCSERYTPDPKQPWKNWHSDDCALAIALDKLAKQKAAKEKTERAEDKRRKAEGMSLQDRKEAVQKLINRCAVLRDWHDGCISCEKGPNWHGTWHGSHYKSVGSNSALRYNLLNISKSCSDCNWHRGGNIAAYEIRLAVKLGPVRLDWLKCHPKSREYDHEYLTRLGSIARRWIKRKEKRLGIR